MQLPTVSPHWRQMLEEAVAQSVDLPSASEVCSLLFDEFAKGTLSGYICVFVCQYQFVGLVQNVHVELSTVTQP